MDTHPFSGLLDDHSVAAKVMLSIEAAVAGSFEADEQRILVPRAVRVTQSEMKRRSEICIGIFRVLRGDLKWSWQRSCDHIRPYLRKALDGESWEPTAKTMWTPNTP